MLSSIQFQPEKVYFLFQKVIFTFMKSNFTKSFKPFFPEIYTQQLQHLHSKKNRDQVAFKNECTPPLLAGSCNNNKDNCSFEKKKWAIQDLFRVFVHGGCTPLGVADKGGIGAGSVTLHQG